MTENTSDDARGLARRNFLRGSLVTATAFTLWPGSSAQAHDDPNCDPTEPDPTPDPPPDPTPDPPPDSGVPMLVPGLRAWYKADDITGAEDGGALTSWPDSSGNGMVLSPVGANAPAWHASVVNGLPSVRFARSSANRVASPAFESTIAAATYFIAFRPSTATYGATSVLLDGRNGRNTLYLSSGRQPTAYAGREVDDRNFALNAADVSPMVLAGVFANQHSVLRFMGQPMAAGNTGSSSLGGVIVGGEYEGQNPFDGDVLEVLLYARTLSDSECRQIESYLGSKWAVPGMRMHQPFVHDDFADGAVAEWTPNPEGGTIRTDDGNLKIVLPGGTAHGSLDDPAIPAPRVQQAVSDGPFDIAVQWDSVAANWGEADGHAIVVTSATQALRLMNGFRVGSNYEERAKFQVSEQGAAKTVAEISKRAASPWIRLRRHGNYWTAYRSPNGVTWYRLAPATYIPDVDVQTIALTAVNGGSSTPAYTAVAARTKDGGGTDPADLRDVVPDRIVATSWHAESFAAGLPSWLEDCSVAGGTATVDGGRLRLSVESTNGSRGGVLFNGTPLRDCGLLTKLTFVGSGFETWVVPSILGQGRPEADQYRPLAAGWAVELTDADTTNRAVKLVRMHDSDSNVGAYDFPEPNVKAFRPTVASFWVRLERRGERVRTRMWADGTAEPTTWLWDLQDHTIPGAGVPSIIYAFNTGERPQGAHVYVDAVTIEELLP